MRVLGTVGAVWAAVTMVMPSQAAKPAPPLGLTVGQDGVLRKDGRPYRGIGVNYFDAFYRHLVKPEDTTYEAGFQALEAAHIPFCRLCGGGFWPNDQRLYQQDKAEFFRRFDAVVRSAERHHVGLIPSLFWNAATVPDLMGEPVSAWGDPASKTRAYMRAYVRDVVTRYRTSPALWGWEFSNEMNLGADLPNASEHRPSVVPSLGTPATRTAKDEWSYALMRATFAAFAREVRRYDAHRLIDTGDGLPRPAAWHNETEKTWIPDTPEQWAQVLRLDNPDPVSAVSVHAYDQDEPFLRRAAAIARRLHKPLFVGEFGAPGPPSESRAGFATFLTAIEQEKVPLAAVWVFDRAGDTFSITPTNDRAYQLQALTAANARLQAGAARNP